MGGDSRSVGRVFESQYRILDGHFSHLFAVNFFCWFEKTNINEKESGMTHCEKKELPLKLLQHS